MAKKEATLWIILLSQEIQGKSVVATATGYRKAADKL